MHQQDTILIVGAGPTGLTLAATLLGHGVRPRIIDKAGEPPADRSRAIVLQARTLEIFRDLGIDRAVLDEALVVDGGTIVLPSGRRGRLNFRPEWVESRFSRLTTLPQEATERHLASLLAVAGLTVERGVALEALEQTADGSGEGIAILRHRDGTIERVAASWIVGADGAHSEVRHAANIAFDGETYPDEAMLGDVDLEWLLPPSEVVVFPNPMGFLLAFPLPGHHRYRVIMIRPATAPPEARELSLADFTAAMLEMSPSSVAPGGPRVVRARWLTRYRLHRRGVPHYRAGCVFLAGDAAHIHSPVGAQGMNTGIQDAYNLGWKLGLVASGRAPEWTLDSYHDERHPVGELLLQRTDQLFGLLARGGWLGRRLRALLPGLGIRLLALPCLGRRVARFMSQTRIRYRRSRLAVEGGSASRLPRRSPRAGERLPDFRLADGTWLHDLVRGAPYTLLVMTPSSMPSDEATGALCRSLTTNYRGTVRCLELDGADSAMRRMSGREGALYLVRPDKHIGFRDVPAGQEALRRVLDAQLLPFARS